MISVPLVIIGQVAVLVVIGVHVLDGGALWNRLTSLSELLVLSQIVANLRLRLIHLLLARVLGSERLVKTSRLGRVGWLSLREGSSGG